MAKYSSKDVTVEVDNASDTLVDLSQYVDSISGIDLEALTQESHGMGDTWEETLPVGVKRMGDITIEGFYDDTATTGPDVILNAIGDTRTVAVTYGSTKKTTVEAVITTYKRTPSRGELTRFSCTLKPTGAPTEA